MINPYNPNSLNTQFRINILGDSEYMKMRDDMKAEHPKLPLDKEMIVFEGCEGDDQIILGGKLPFLSHFCTLFNFNICHAPGDSKFVKRNAELFNDPNKLDSLLKKMDVRDIE